MCVGERVDVRPTQRPGQRRSRFVTRTLCRNPAYGQPNRTPASARSHGNIGRSGQIVAEGDQTGDEQLPARPSAHDGSCRGHIPRHEDSTHVPLALDKIEAVIGRLVDGDSCLRIGLMPARDGLGGCNGFASLLAQAVDCLLYVGSGAAGPDDADTEAQCLQITDEGVSQRREDPPEQDVPRGLDLDVAWLGGRFDAGVD